ncbi:MAG TPA: hypothetical protein VFU13_10035 [Steroidobacteraceae bacterium]|nr:hypothetical protein [Steroidobacteraceae bacterium]
MTASAFAESSAPGLYWLGEPALPSNYGIALIPASDSGLPQTIAFADSWTTYPGFYVMTATRPATADEASFLDSARQLAGWLGSQARFAWSADTTGDVGTWNAQAMLVAQTGGASSGTVVAPARLMFGAYGVTISAGIVVTLSADGFTLTGGPALPFALTTPNDIWALTSSGNTALSFSGVNAGCVSLALALPQDRSGSGIDDYTRLDVCARTAVGTTWDVEAQSGLLQSLQYPVFTGVPTGGVSFNGTFDAARPLDASRTSLLFASAPTHGSYYRAPLGYAASMTPQISGSAPAGLAFHRRPPSVRPTDGDDPFYLAPIGTFSLALSGSATQLACGTSGYEYFGLSGPSAATVTFAPSQPAYADGLVKPAMALVQPGGATTDDDTGVTLSAIATCPYSSVTPSTGQTATYYAQPQSGALHQIRASGDSSLLPYLPFLPIPAGAAGTGNGGAYPFLPYAGVSSDDAPLCALVEAQVLSPTRRQTLMSLTSATASGSATTAVTPRGLLANFGSGLAWSSLQLAAYPGDSTSNLNTIESAPPGTFIPPPLELLTPGPDLRNALLSNELFLVIADATAFDDETDYNYWVTDAALSDLRALPQSQRPNDAVLSALDRARTAQAGETAFVAYLNGVLPPGWTTWQSVIVQFCAYFELNIEGWRFRLSPTVWGVNADPDHPVIMIFKFASLSLRSLAADPGSWIWPAVSAIDGNTQKTAGILAAIIADADQQVAAATSGSPSPLQFFVDRVVDDPSWNGVLVFNAQVPIDDLPPELQGLAAGIDATRFRAHHAGVSVSPVTVDTATRTLSLRATPLFGLIDYQSPDDIAQTYDDFDFKVLLLRVLFQNSAVADFASRVELFVNRLFGDLVNLVPSEHYNNLILDGSYQRTPSGGHYVFATSTPARYYSTSKVVDSIEVSRAQFNTLAGGTTVASRFSLWGRLRFALLDQFDLFSFGAVQPSPASPVIDGWLAFGGLAVDMTFQSSDPQGTRAFSVNLETIAFDGANSVPRNESFFRRFPLQLAGMIRGVPGTQPRDQGFLAVKVPLYQPALNDGWHALTFTIDMGTLGALAADAGLTMTLAAAWGPGTNQAVVNVGLKLPGVQTIGQLLPIQGVLGLGFQGIELDASPAPTGGPSYVMRLRRFYLQLLGWKFPPGQADVYLFGDPEIASVPAGGRRGALGWYAAYRKKG